MLFFRRIARGAALVSAVIGAGCSPHLFNPDEFNRNAPTFNKPVADREEVSFCYNGWVTSKERVVEMAGEECARFGRQASFTSTSFGECPLSTPTEVQFACHKVAAD